MEIFKKIANKNYWISSVVIVLSLMLFEKYLSNWVLKYITFLPTIVLSFLSLLVILIISKLISEEILEL